MYMLLLPQTFYILIGLVVAVRDSDFLKMLDHDFERERLLLMERVNHSLELTSNRASSILSLGQDVLVEIVGYLNHRWHFERAMLSCPDIHRACTTFLNNKFVYLLLTQCSIKGLNTLTTILS